jgi:hypothetical protein
MNFPSDVARTLAQMLEARLPGRAAEVAQDARVAPPLSEGVEAWMEVLLIADRAGAVRLAGVLAELAPGDPDLAVVRRELDGSRERLRRAALGVAVVGFGIAAGMLLFPAAGPDRAVPAPAETAPVASGVPETTPVPAPSAPTGVPTGTAALTAAPAAGPASATPAYGPAAPGTAPAPGTVVAPSPSMPAAPKASAAPAVYGPPLPPNWVPTPVPGVAPVWPAATYVAPAPSVAAPVAPTAAPAVPSAAAPSAAAPSAGQAPAAP